MKWLDVMKEGEETLLLALYLKNMTPVLTNTTCSCL